MGLRRRFTMVTGIRLKTPKRSRVLGKRSVVPVSPQVGRPMILETLKNPCSALPYHALEELGRLFPDAYILETNDSASFNWQDFASIGLCEARPKSGFVPEWIHSWIPEKNLLQQKYANGMFEVRWEDRELILLHLQFETQCGNPNFSWIVAPDQEAARDFFAAVCRWSNALREEVLVYQEGYWEKDHELYQSIQSSRLEGLIMAPGLKETIRDDAKLFFDSRERYHQFNIPWKRGLIFLGPPGNGKTHMIQALVNDLGQSCLYVKSLKSRFQNEDRSLREIFEKARQSAPCILVLEDVDALIDDENRSFFLNELDGFRKNEGILVIATTNHPGKLDPAIVDRPSRFDRKYHFELPALPERLAYMQWWNARQDQALRISDATIKTLGTGTEGFSFAYLKELVLSSTMAWMNGQNPDMDQIVAAQLTLLRGQMVSSFSAVAQPVAPVE